MFSRLKSELGNIRDRLRGGVATNGPVDDAPDALQDIEFRTMDPKSGAEGGRLLCPVTRGELRKGDRVYQCRACLTAYSEAGWAFLRETDRGRCCACGMVRTVHLTS